MKISEERKFAPDRGQGAAAQRTVLYAPARIMKKTEVFPRPEGFEIKAIFFRTKTQLEKQEQEKHEWEPDGSRRRRLHRDTFGGPPATWRCAERR